MYSFYVWAVIILVVGFILLNLPFHAITGCIQKYCHSQKFMEAEGEINFSEDIY